MHFGKYEIVVVFKTNFFSIGFSNRYSFYVLGSTVVRLFRFLRIMRVIFFYQQECGKINFLLINDSFTPVIGIIDN